MSLRQITLDRLRNELPTDLQEQLTNEVITNAWICQVIDPDSESESNLTRIVFQTKEKDWMQRAVVYDEQFIRLILSQVMLGSPKFSEEIFYILDKEEGNISWKSVRNRLFSPFDEDDGELIFSFNKNGTGEFINVKNFSKKYNPKYNFNEKEQTLLLKDYDIDIHELIDFLEENEHRKNITSWIELYIAERNRRNRRLSIDSSLLRLSRDPSPVRSRSPVNLRDSRSPSPVRERY